MRGNESTSNRHVLRPFAPAVAGGLLVAAVAPLPAHAAEPSSVCADVRSADPTAPDGTYTVLAGGRSLTLYCHDMAGTPREFIDLVETGEDRNFAQYGAGGASPGTDVRTRFTKLRIDPATLTVDVGDLTFATSTGTLQHAHAPVTSMPYGVAMSCDHGVLGVGNIDLRGTPFSVADPFEVQGFDAAGSSTPSADGQVVDLTGRGMCGWIGAAPGGWQPMNPAPGHFDLELTVAGTATSTTLTVSPDGPTQAGTEKTLTATVTPAAVGTVVFQNGGTAVGEPVAVTGGVASTKVKLPAGTHALTATFVPTDPAVFVGSVSEAVSLAFYETGTRTQFVAVPRSVPSNGGVVLGVRVQPGNADGTVQFKDNGTNLGNPVQVRRGYVLVGARLPVGAHSLTAVFTPDDSVAYGPSTSPAAEVTVRPGR